MDLDNEYKKGIKNTECPICLDREKNTAFNCGHLVCYCCKLETIKYIYNKYKLMTMMVDDNNANILYYACAGSQTIDVFKFLHEQNPNLIKQLCLYVDQTKYYVMNYLFKACESGCSYEVIKYLHELDPTMSVGRTTNNTNVLMFACNNNYDLETIKYLHHLDETMITQMDGSHNTDKCYQVTTAVLNECYNELEIHKVDLKGTVLKPNMVIPGSECKDKSSAEEIAKKTLDCLKKNVPGEVPGIAFLSGGQSEIESSKNLNEINKINDSNFLITFSYGRGLQASALKEFGKNQENFENIQKAFNHRAKMNGLSSKGEWSEELEKESAA